MSPKETRACAVCGCVLNRYSDAFGLNEYWDHAEIEVDHPPVPVTLAEITANYRCDFCLADHAGWALPAEDYEVANGNWSRGDWLACSDCAVLIQEDDWRGVADRASAVSGHSPEVFGLMYAQLREHLTGELTPKRQ